MHWLHWLPFLVRLGRLAPPTGHMLAATHGSTSSGCAQCLSGSAVVGLSCKSGIVGGVFFFLATVARVVIFPLGFSLTCLLTIFLWVLVLVMGFV